jgi:hypothetical protein
MVKRVAEQDAAVGHARLRLPLKWNILASPSNERRFAVDDAIQTAGPFSNMDVISKWNVSDGSPRASLEMSMRRACSGLRR